MKDNRISIKSSKFVRDFLENLSCTRRSNIVGTDKQQITIADALDLVVVYFKTNGDRFKELVNMEFDKNVRPN